MKGKFGKVSKYTLFVLLSLCIAGGVFLLVDIGLDGILGSRFESAFIQHAEDTYIRLDGTMHSIHGQFIRWEELKLFLSILTMVLTALWAVSIVAVIALCERHYTKRAAQKSSKLIREIFTQTEATAIIVSKEYADAAACANELKVKMLQSQQVLQLEATQKNDLIAYLAHDLKTPLTSVIGYLSLLDEIPEMPMEQRAKYVHITLDKAIRLEKLINEFFEITRYNLHEIVLETEAIDLGYMLRQMADEFYPILSAHGNTISLEAAAELKVVADPNKLARVFHNILKNAIAYSHASTPIHIRAEQAQDKVRITFTDTGKTIPQQTLDPMFEKFYRLDDARATNTGGAGLGLAIARDIVTAHGGTITAASENQITTFTVELPA